MKNYHEKSKTEQARLPRRGKVVRGDDPRRWTDCMSVCRFRTDDVSLVACASDSSEPYNNRPIVELRAADEITTSERLGFLVDSPSSIPIRRTTTGSTLPPALNDVRQ